MGPFFDKGSHTWVLDKNRSQQVLRCFFKRHGLIWNERDAEMFKKNIGEVFLKKLNGSSVCTTHLVMFNFVKLDSVPTKMRTELTLHHQQRSALQCTEEKEHHFSMSFTKTILPKKTSPNKNTYSNFQKITSHSQLLPKKNFNQKTNNKPPTSTVPHLTASIMASTSSFSAIYFGSTTGGTCGSPLCSRTVPRLCGWFPMVINWRGSIVATKMHRECKVTGCQYSTKKT